MIERGARFLKNWHGGNLKASGGQVVRFVKTGKDSALTRNHEKILPRSSIRKETQLEEGKESQGPKKKESYVNLRIGICRNSERKMARCAACLPQHEGGRE